MAIMQEPIPPVRRQGGSEAMAELLWTKKENVLIARLVVPQPISQEDLDSIGRELMESPEKSEGRILLDFRGVKFISSLLLAKLINFKKHCRSSHTDLKLCGVTPQVMEVIRMTRLDALFDIYSSEKEALAAF
jgi:anti-sigma B factor antagonist